MARPLRLLVPGGTYHVVSRGNARQSIFVDDDDRWRFFETLETTLLAYDARCHAYCLMGNHYHLLLETKRPNLSRAMRQLNGVYGQGFNRRHARTGHVFQGRFSATLVDREAYLLEVCRYIVLNPVRAGLVERPEDWRFSSHRAYAGVEAAPAFLSTASLLAAFDPRGGADGRRSYVRLRRLRIDRTGSRRTNPGGTADAGRHGSATRAGIRRCSRFEDGSSFVPEGAAARGATEPRGPVLWMHRPTRAEPLDSRGPRAARLHPARNRAPSRVAPIHRQPAGSPGTARTGTATRGGRRGTDTWIRDLTPNQVSS